MNSTLMPNLPQAQRFVAVLTGGKAATFQTFSDGEKVVEKRPDQGDRNLTPQIFHGTLVQHAPALERLNAKGAGVFIMINQGDGKGRRTQNVTRVTALFVDTDGAPYPRALPLKPHLVVRSSPGRWHLYWLVKDIPRETFSVFQRALAKHYGTDSSVRDLPRVMRLPGFYHRKGAPVMVQLLEAHDHPAYPVAEVFAAWPSLPEALAKAKAEEARRARERAEIVQRAAERRAKPMTATNEREQAQRLLQHHHNTVATAPEGQRNVTLCRAAYTLGGYVASGYLDTLEAEDMLVAAALVSGLSESEAKELILRVLRKGMAQPLELGRNGVDVFRSAQPMQSSATPAKGIARFFADGNGHKPDVCKRAKGIWGRAHRGLL